MIIREHDEHFIQTNYDPQDMCPASSPSGPTSCTNMISPNPYIVFSPLMLLWVPSGGAKLAPAPNPPQLLPHKHLEYDPMGSLPPL